MMTYQSIVENYRVSQYLRMKTNEQLQERYRDLINNLWATNEDGEVIPPYDANNRGQILRLLIEVIAESIMRKIYPAFGFDEALIRKEASKDYVTPKILKPHPIMPTSFAKFGKYRYLIDTWKIGRIRIAPGSAYTDPSLNMAQQDNELENYTQTPNKQLRVRMLEMSPCGNKKEIPVMLKEFFEYKCTGDFYVWCCAMRYDARLFTAFDADAALIITDNVEFQRRLTTAVSQKADTFIAAKPIRYYDPYTTSKEDLDPYFSKNFKYLYQNEYRFVWKNVAPVPLSPFFVEIGSIEDIAFLVTIA